ncbi:MAG: hypothetical protein ACKORI_00175 [Verrucomicrobiota bacterium]
MHGKDVSSLLRDPASAWSQPAITTYGRGNHAVRSEDWRYIRYANGDEELYHDAKDPLEYVNLATKPEFASKKAELAAFLPKNEKPDLPRKRGGEEGEGGEPAQKKGKGKKKQK